jgi:hypothetical protein
MNIRQKIIKKAKKSKVTSVACLLRTSLTEKPQSFKFLQEFFIENYYFHRTRDYIESEKLNSIFMIA